MKRIRTKWFAPSVPISAWLLSATLILLVICSQLFVYVPDASALTQRGGGGGGASWSGGGASITATFIDASHIAIAASGTYTWTSGGNKEVVDFSGLQGIYYAGHMSPYYQDNFTPPTGAKYWFENNYNQESTGGSNCNTDVDIVTYSPGSVTLRINPHLQAEDGSSSQIGSCLAVQMPNGTGSVNFAANDLGAGSNVTTFNATGTGYPRAVTYNNAASSTIMFYENGSSEIDATTVDTSLGTGNGGQFIFKEEGSTNNYQEQSPNGNGGCSNPDSIILSGNSGQTVTANYTYYDNNCGPHKYTVLILSTTPEAAASSITGSQPGGNCNKDANGNCTATNPDAVNCVSGSGFLTATLNWIVCGAINLAWGAANTLDGWITNTLDVDVSGIFDNTGANGASQGYYIAWNSFRIIATALLVIGGLIMVASQAFGFEVLDAYTVRKVLPRLLVAIIGISLSWPLMRLTVSFFDTLGIDIRELMYAPFHSLGGTVSVGVGILTYIGIGAAVFVLGFASLTFLLTALLAAFVGFMILVIRQVGIIMLIIVAPVAIACYILPNTQKVWKLWYDNFLGLMLMFPIISALIAAGHIFSAVTLKGGVGGGVVAQAIGLIAYFAPYFMLPMAARLATGIIGNIAGFVHAQHKGAFGVLGNIRQQSAKGHHEDRMAGNTWLGSGQTGSLYRRAALFGRQGSWNPSARGRARFEQHEMRARGALAAEALKNDNGRAAGDDAANEVAQMRDTNARNFVDRYVPLATARNPRLTVAEARAQGRDALGMLEVGYGARMGSDAMRVASFNAQQLSPSGYGDTDADLAKRINDAHAMVRDNLISASDAMATIKQNKARVEASGISFPRGAEAIQNGGATAASIAPLMDSTLDGLTPGSLVGARRESGVMLARHQYRRLRDTVTAAGGNLDDDRVKVMVGRVAGLQDVINQEAPQVAEPFARELYSRPLAGASANPTINAPGVTVRGVSDELRRVQDGTFNDIRKEWLGSGPGPGVVGGGTPSDIRLKRDIHTIQQINGIQLYRFKYLWSDQEYVGVMAQDLIETHPEALILDNNGFYMVDYGKLGLRMMTIEEWKASRNSLHQSASTRA